jgi:hypothetical protein
MAKLAQIGWHILAGAAACFLIYLKFQMMKGESDRCDRKSGIQGFLKKIEWSTQQLRLQSLAVKSSHGLHIEGHKRLPS